MATTDWAGGRTSMDLGPGRIEVSETLANVDAWDVADYSDLGGTDKISFDSELKKAGLKESQGGDRDGDRVVTAQTAKFTFGLSRGFAERLKQVWQGFTIETDSLDNPVQIKLAKRLSQRDSTILVWVRFTAYKNGAPSTNPFDILYAKVAPSADAISLAYDVSTQRYVPIMLEAYEETTVTDDNGQPCYWWTARDE